jgi:hypothetical protein
MRSTISRLHLLTLLFTTVPSIDAHAFWSSDVAVNTPICALPNSVINPFVLEDGAGGVFVLWYEQRFGPTTLNLFMQHLDALGRTTLPANGVQLPAGTGIQFAPRAVLDGAGGVIVAYGQAPSLAGASSADVYAQRYDANASPVWGAPVPVCTAPNAVTELRIASDGANGAVVVWSDNRNGVDSDLFAQRITAAGAVSWVVNGVSLCAAAGDKFEFVAVPDGLGGTYVTWVDPRTNRDIYVEHVSPTGTLRYGSDGLVVCNAAGNQTSVTAIGDGQAGAIIAWSDGRVAQSDVYAQRITPGGLEWTANGEVVSDAAGFQSTPTLAPDGDAGAFVAWTDAPGGIINVRANRITRHGFLMWGATGIALSTGIGAQVPVAVTDHAGGFIVVFEDFRPPSISLYAQRVDANGIVQWAVNGTPVTRAPDDQNYHVVVSDGRNGAIVVWEDFRRDGTDTDIYGERIEGFGYVGVPEPVIASALDVPNDQGGQVKVSWHGSWPELPPANAIDYYNVFRSVPPTAALEAQRGGKRIEKGTCESDDCLLATSNGVQTDFWEFVGSQNAFDLTGYSMVVPTTGDSVGGSNPLTKFLVQARSNSGPQYWTSPPDSGYSVDDLAPAAPVPFAGIYESGATSMLWGANVEADLAGYRLHRGHTVGFVPGPSNLVVQTTETTFTDAAGSPFYYKLAAIDVHGNLSAYSLLVPSGTTAVGDGSTLALALEPVSPNPVRNGARMRFTLPSAAAVRLTVFDAQGRAVRELARGEWAAGEHAVAWDGSDRSGRRVGAGIYVARLSVAGDERVRRFVVVP